MKSAFSTLEKASHKLAEEAYKQAAASQEGKADSNGAAAESTDKDDVVDADYEEVRDSK